MLRSIARALLVVSVLVAVPVAVLLSMPRLAAATPGPDSVVVIANANVPESVALAERYAAERDVPARQVCLLDLADTEDLSLDDYRATFVAPLDACLEAGGVRARIEAALLVRGVPLRVTIPDGGSDRPVSLAAALMLWDSALEDGTPMLGQPSGQSGSCGATACYAARWQNPFGGFAFEPGWEVTRRGVVWRPILVTMLHGRSYEDAARLLDSALEAEATGAVFDGELLLMDGADGARGALDFQNDAVVEGLTDRGFTATRVPFDSDLIGRDLSAFVTGTANLGETIEGNEFRPGSVVDNLTSFGAVPQNFRETGESQVSIARWVAKGVAGVHGTVAEPLNNCFPQRDFLLAYVDGATLAEAYHSRMPFVYWRNLVLGDPMAAPFAMRPEVTVTGLEDGERVSRARMMSVDAVDPGGRGVASIALYLDGVEVARSEGDALEHCLRVPPGDDHQLLIVARAADDPTDARPYRPKGWVALTVHSDGESADCSIPVHDASVPTPDGGTPGIDGGTGAPEGGCGCRAVGAPLDRSGLCFVMLAIVGLVARRRRAPAAS